MQLSVEAVLFDLDGVLVDSTRTVERHWRLFCREHDLSVEAVLPFVHGRRTADNVRSLAPHLDIDAVAAAFDELEVSDVEGLRVLPGAREVLESLSGARWAVVTSGTRAVASARLRAATLPVPDVLVAAEDVARGKPEPDGYVAAAASLGRPPAACLVVEDTAPGVAAGRAAGARTLALLTTRDASELTDADFVVADLRSCSVVSVSPTGSVTLDLSAPPDSSLGPE